jgi:uncharacterized membrane protein
MKLFGQMDWKERTDRAQEQISLTRRSIFAFTTTFYCLFVVTYILWTGAATPLAEKAVGALMSFAETMAMLYLGASVIDRSKVLTKIGESWGTSSVTTKVDNQNVDRPA